MGGIINYLHGESGRIIDRQLILGEEQRVHALRLEANPHREFAYDYGADIGIDPVLETGDWTIFVRTDPYTGIWVRETDGFYPELQEAIDRVAGERRKELGPGLVRVRLHGVWAEQYIGALAERRTPMQFPDRPATSVSFFLSFSSANVMLARQVFADLKYDAKVEVWFDLDQEGESPEHERHIEAWLRNAVYSRRGFVLLWTRAASESFWVRKEIAWATERAACERDFRLIVLKLDDTPIPAELLDVRYVIDCHGLWPVNGINEELFAAVTERRGRTAWIEQHLRREIKIERNEGGAGYEPFRSDSGIAKSLRYWDDGGGEVRWELEYEQKGTLRRASGFGRQQAVDLGISLGDYIGFFVCHRAPLVRFGPGTPLWMRSRDLQLLPENVLATYLRADNVNSGPGREAK